MLAGELFAVRDAAPEGTGGQGQGTRGGRDHVWPFGRTADQRATCSPGPRKSYRPTWILSFSSNY